MGGREKGRLKFSEKFVNKMSSTYFFSCLFFVQKQIFLNSNCLIQNVLTEMPTPRPMGLSSVTKFGEFLISFSHLLRIYFVFGKILINFVNFCIPLGKFLLL